MPTLTVSMPAYNVEPYIRQAVDSILCQEGVDLELIVVDDGSTDQTAEVVASCQDARLRLLRNGRQMGISYCHNVVLRESRSPFIAHVDADDFLLPGALRKMVETLESDPSIGQAHCYFFDVDAHGRTTRETFHERWASFRRKRPPTLDYKAALLRGANVTNALRTYRRAVLAELGGFNETLRFGEDYDMALRVLDRYTIKLVPEFLYCRRIHGTNTTESLRGKAIRFWVQTYRIRRQLVRAKKVKFLTDVQCDLHRRLGTQVQGAARRMMARGRAILRQGATLLKWRVVAPVAATLYWSVVNYLSWWPLAWFGRQPTRRGTDERRIAYYHHAFPILSETFIQREVAALQRAGLAVEVIAHEAHDVAYLGDDARALMQKTHYLAPLGLQKLARYAWSFLRRRPLTLMNIFLHVICCRYDARKSFGLDVHVLQRTLYLAGVLQEKGVNHLHAPWASLDAFVALLAARLLQIPYTVQARAFDLHRHSSACGLPTKLTPAQWVVTNAQYNASILKSLLPLGSEKVHTIYEGIDPEQFRPGNDKRAHDGVVRILSVARLVEPKGLEYLIGACKLLKDSGYTVRCEIIGGRVATEANYYLRLQKLRQALALEQEVTFLGTQPFARVLEKYAEADMFVLPSVVAGDGSGDVTPNVVIEAMAMKLPVISTKSRGIPELVEDGVSGLLVPPRDEQALALAIRRLLADKALRVTLGNNARKKVEEQFDINKNITQFIALFQRGR